MRERRLCLGNGVVIETYANGQDRCASAVVDVGSGESGEMRDCLVGTREGEGHRGGTPLLADQPRQVIRQVRVGRLRQPRESTARSSPSSPSRSAPSSTGSARPGRRRGNPRDVVEELEASGVLAYTQHVALEVLQVAPAERLVTVVDVRIQVRLLGRLSFSLV